MTGFLSVTPSDLTLAKQNKRVRKGSLFLVYKSVIIPQRTEGVWDFKHQMHHTKMQVLSEEQLTQ